MTKAAPGIIISDDKNPQLSRALSEQEDDARHREDKIQRTQHNGEFAGSDAALPDHNKTKLVGDKAHISQKVYYFPESFNALREELERYYPTFFYLVNPDIGCSPAHAMVFDAPHFVGMCNGALGTVVQFDSENVDGICKTFLNEFRKLRGASPLSF